MGITVRDATKADVPTILDIYNYEVLHGTATFDIEPKTLADRLIWFRETQRPPHRVIVADDGARVAGGAACIRSTQERLIASLPRTRSTFTRTGGAKGSAS